MRVMRAGLRRRRLDRGWSLKDVAEHLVALGREVGEPCLGLDGITVGRWERGERQPRAPYPKLLCLLYEATAFELGIVDFAQDPGCGRLDDDVERRNLLRLLAGALAAPVLARTADADRLAHAMSRPSRVGDEAVAVVEAAIANARRLDDVLGSRAAVKPALAQREVIQALLKGGPRGAVAKRLTAAAAELSQFLGWCVNDYAISRACLDEALQLAHEADAESLGAYVLGHRSVIEMDEERPLDGLAFAEAARGRAEGSGSPATRSWVAGREADALAKLGDRNGAERALDRSRQAFARSRPEDEPPWMYYYDEALLDYRDGSVYVTLGVSEPARRAMQQAIATFDASMVRDRAWCLAILGETYVLDGEADEACRVAGEALTIATDTRCDRVVVRVRALRTKLEPWAAGPMVRDLDDQIAATAAWARPVTV